MPAVLVWGRQVVQGRPQAWGAGFREVRVAQRGNAGQGMLQSFGEAM